MRRHRLRLPPGLSPTRPQRVCTSTTLRWFPELPTNFQNVKKRCVVLRGPAVDLPDGCREGKQAHAAVDGVRDASDGDRASDDGDRASAAAVLAL